MNRDPGSRRRTAALAALAGDLKWMLQRSLGRVRFSREDTRVEGQDMNDPFGEAREELLRLHAAWAGARRESNQALAADTKDDYPQKFQRERELFQTLELARIVFVKRWVDRALRYWMDTGGSKADWWAPVSKDDARTRLDVLLHDDYETNDDYCFLEDRAILEFRIEKEEQAPKDVSQLVWIVCGKKGRQYSTIAKYLQKDLTSQPDPLGQMVEIMARKEQFSTTPTHAQEQFSAEQP